MARFKIHRSWGRWVGLAVIVGLVGLGSGLLLLRLVRPPARALAGQNRPRETATVGRGTREDSEVGREYDVIAQRNVFQPLQPMPHRRLTSPASPVRRGGGNGGRATPLRGGTSPQFPVPPGFFQPVLEGPSPDQQKAAEAPSSPASAGGFGGGFPGGGGGGFPGGFGGGGAPSPTGGSPSSNQPRVTVTGVVRTGRGVKVLVEDLESGQSTLVAPGGEAFGYRVSQVDEHKGTAQVERGGQVQRLKLGENKVTKKPSPAPIPPSGGGGPPGPAGGFGGNRPESGRPGEAPGPTPPGPPPGGMVPPSGPPGG